MELDIMRAIIADILHVDEREVNEDTIFFEDLGADSLDIFQIVSQAEDRWQITLSEADCAGMKTVGELIDLVKSKI